MDRTALRLAEKMRLTVLPLCGATKDGGYDAIGSGILVKFEDRPCLVTAKHVLDYNEGDIYDPLNDPTTLYVGNPAGSSHVVLTGEATRLAERLGRPREIASAQMARGAASLLCGEFRRAADGIDVQRNAVNRYFCLNQVTGGPRNIGHNGNVFARQQIQ